MKPSILFFVFVLLFQCTYGQQYQPSLVGDRCKNCNQGPNRGGLGVVNNQLAILTRDTNLHNRLWSYNGKDTITWVNQPGWRTFIANAGYNGCAVVNNMFFFTGRGEDQPSFKLELWGWDGINAPKPVLNINPDPSHGVYHDGMLGHNNRLYFYSVAPASTPAINAWSSALCEYDPVKGTFKRFYFADSVTNPKSPFYTLTSFKNKIYICNPIVFSPPDLFVADPSGDDTLRKVHHASKKLQIISNLVAHNDSMYFTAYNADSGTQLYVYAGTDTAAIISGFPKYGTGYYSELGKTAIAYKDNIYFSYDSSTATDTKLRVYAYNTKLKTIQEVLQIPPANKVVEFLKVYKEKLILQVDSVTYVYNGTKIDTMQPFGFRPNAFAEYNGGLYAMGTTKEYGYEVYRLNDTLLTTSIQSIRFNADVQLYPNPTGADAYININLQEATSILAVVTDIAGRQVYSSKQVLYSSGESKITLPLHNTPSGNYIVSLRDNNGRPLWTGKLLKQ